MLDITFVNGIMCFMWKFYKILRQKPTQAVFDQPNHDNKYKSRLNFSKPIRPMFVSFFFGPQPKNSTL